MENQNESGRKLPGKLELLRERKVLSAAEIARKYGVSRARVYQVLANAKKEYPDEVFASEDPFSPENIAAMRKEYTLPEVIAMTGLSRAAVNYKTEKSGADKGDFKKARQTLSDEFLTEIRKEYETKKAKEIAEEYGVAVETVYVWLQKPCSYERKAKRKKKE